MLVATAVIYYIPLSPSAFVLSCFYYHILVATAAVCCLT